MNFGTDSLGENPIINAREVEIGARFLRLTSYYRWPDVEPSLGSFNFTKLDSIMSRASGRKVIYPACDCPSWTTDQPDLVLSEYPKYCATVVRRYPQLFSIELWNELDAADYRPGFFPAGIHTSLPCAKDFAGQVLFLSQLIVRTVRAIRQFNTLIKIVGPAWATPAHEVGMRLLKETGALSGLSAVSFHDYFGNIPIPTEGMWADDTNYLYNPTEQGQRYRSMLGQKPVWVTEFGVNELNVELQLRAYKSWGVQLVVAHNLAMSSDIAGQDHWTQGYNPDGTQKTGTKKWCQLMKELS